jgi:amino acid transporter
VITSAITAGIAAILAYFGVKPGLYLGAVWVAVKVIIVGGVAGVMWWRSRVEQRKAGHATSPELPPSTKTPDKN